MSSDLEKKEAVIFDTYSETDGSIYDVSSATAAEIQYVMSVLGYDKVSSSTELHDRNFLILLRGIQGLTFEQAQKIVTETVNESVDDRNFPPVLYNLFIESQNYGQKDIIMEGVSGDWAVRTLGGIMHYSSPYPEVRSATNFWDNPEEPCETLRLYFLTTVYIGILSFVNQFFSIRMPAISLPASFIQMIAVPSGQFLARILPDWGFTYKGTRHSLNPGPWTYKEQSLFLVALGQAGNPYVDSQILVQKLDVFYGNEWANFGYQLLLTLSTQFLGFGLAGIFRNVLVYPTQNMFMGNFSSMALNNALIAKEKKEKINGWSLSRYHIFAIVFGVIFFYEWLPLYLMGFLSVFNWMTWIAPQNLNLAVVTGSNDGLGYNPIPTFDWNIIGTSGMSYPFFSTANTVAGTALAGLVILGVWYSNMLYTGYLPINSNMVFTNTGDNYRVQSIITDGVVDPVKYQEYSPPYYSAANLVTYGAFFAIYTSIYVTTLLYDYKILWDSFKQIYYGVLGRGKGIKDYNDPHSRMMQKYKETPQWWFIIVLLISLGLGIAAIKAYPTATPVWGIFLAIGLTIVFIVPASILSSRTGNSISINVLTELIVGYAIPGRGVALMILKSFGVNTHVQATAYISDLKVAHYTKVPPRAAFRAQMWATIVVLFISLGTIQFQLTIPDVCTKLLKSTSKFTCPGENTFYSASVVWGAIGPKRIFDAEYPILKWCFLIGAVIPIPFWALRRFVPKARNSLKHIDPNLLILGFLNFAPYNLTYYLPSLYLAAITMFFIKRRYTKWFEKYNYVIAAGINVGTALAAFIIFWAVQYHPKDLNWWGNEVSYNGVDGEGATLLPIPDEGYFGRAPGDYIF